MVYHAFATPNSSNDKEIYNYTALKRKRCSMFCCVQFFLCNRIATPLLLFSNVQRLELMYTDRFPNNTRKHLHYNFIKPHHRLDVRFCVCVYCNHSNRKFVFACINDIYTLHLYRTPSHIPLFIHIETSCLINCIAFSHTPQKHIFTFSPKKSFVIGKLHDI